MHKSKDNKKNTIFKIGSVNLIRVRNFGDQSNNAIKGDIARATQSTIRDIDSNKENKQDVLDCVEEINKIVEGGADESPRIQLE